MKHLMFTFVLAITTSICLFADNPHEDYVWAIVPDHPDWIYKTGEKPVLDIQLYKYGMPVQEQELTYTISQRISSKERDGFPTGKVILKNGRCSFTVPARLKPGFTEIIFTFIDPAYSKKVESHITVGFDPDKIKPYTQEPEDFTEFWKNEIAANRKDIPLNYTSVIVEDLSNDKVEVRLVKLQIDNLHCMHGYLGIPRNATPGSCPVLLRPPGAGIKRDKGSAGYAYDGIITASIEIHGIDPRLDEERYEEITNAFKTSRIHPYFTIGIENRERYYMKHVYLGLVKWIDLLTSLEQWDGKNVIVRGGSQGGALSLVAAGLDERVTMCVPNYPALTDMMAALDTTRASGYPHFERVKGFLDENAQKTIPYFDTVNFSKHITCPVLMTWGYNDGTCPPDCCYAAWNVMTCPKEKFITNHSEHWGTQETQNVITKWVLDHLK